MNTRQKPISPVIRTDAKPLPENPFRALREELRLDRAEFATLVAGLSGGSISAKAIQTWEEDHAFPRDHNLEAVIRLAERNRYPLSYRTLISYRRARRNGGPEVV